MRPELWIFVAMAVAIVVVAVIVMWSAAKDAKDHYQ